MRPPLVRPSLPISRRTLLRHGALAAASLAVAPVVQAQGRVLRMTQLLDTSNEQLELSRDYATGVRLAMTELAQSGARLPQLSTVEVDGTPESLRRALQAVKDDSSQVALLGTAGERLALASIPMARQMGLQMAHMAPWLADTRYDDDEQVCGLFASRETQVQRALQGFATVGVNELGVVYANAALEQALHPGMVRGIEKLGLRMLRFTPPANQDMAAFGAAFPAQSPMMLLFVGGTVELALFSQGLSQRKLQRYVVCLSDVDLNTLMQLGPGKAVPLIFSQVVPNPQSSSLAVVRMYRSALKQYLDEVPSPLSLAGYIAGRYAGHVLSLRYDGGLNRASLLAEMKRRPTVDLGGLSIDFARDGRGSSFVTQTLLQGNGKLLG